MTTWENLLATLAYPAALVLLLLVRMVREVRETRGELRLLRQVLLKVVKHMDTQLRKVESEEKADNGSP